MQTQTAFTNTQRSAIEALSQDLAGAKRRTVTTEYGTTDGGQHWASLCTEDAKQVPTAFVSIVVGAGVDGEASVLARDGSPVRERVTFADALRLARRVGVRGVPRRTGGHTEVEVS